MLRPADRPGRALDIPAPNASAALTPYLGARAVTLLPCPTRADQITAPQISAAPVIRTAFNMAFYKNKNVETLIRAIAAASAQIPDISLDIIGGGDRSAFLTVAQMIDQIAPGRVRLLGARPQAEMQQLLHSATASSSWRVSSAVTPRLNAVRPTSG